MKKITVFLSAAILLVTLFTSMSFTALPPGPSANGQGSLTRPGELQRRFAFHANTMPNGDVKGSGVLTITGGEAQIKFDINCLSINGSTAIMAGKVTSVSGNTAFQVGWDCWFKVVDNGEGSNAAPDQITLLSGNPGGLDCTIQVIGNNPLNDIEGGNIQVKN
jgi:hypothetical protein